VVEAMMLQRRLAMYAMLATSAVLGPP